MTDSAFDHGSTGRLTTHDVGRFTGDSLFDGIARAVCAAGCLPRKELYEAWEMARRVRRVCRGGRVVDLAGGHGLLAQILLLLDDTSPEAIVADAVLPPSHATLHAAIVAAWPRLSGRVRFDAQRIEDVPIAPADLVVSCHACGALTDAVIERAAAARARVAVLPCCHDHARGDAPAPAGLSHLDEDDSGGGHAAQPAPRRGADRRGVSRGATWPRWPRPS